MREEIEQWCPVYYVSKMMLRPKTRYSRVKQLVLALVIAARNLKPYFQAHIVVVLTIQPLRLILMKLDVFRRLVRWLVKLSEFDMKF